ncbi:hypothetical protein [Nostoc sp. 'Peltigera malacea cyanobiont' DB3992]|uniref:hypothetical protein n=1 Tax=Nostoc sp. 'Peltigera malacea cyanobiont' DB3992 TaxID=1206980 RepID=UPI0015D491D4|nr:hypothetical protein [Nostoc sp. 'Peltigera malacea cyanobiont' DB3992]
MTNKELLQIIEQAVRDKVTGKLKTKTINSSQMSNQPQALKSSGGTLHSKKELDEGMKEVGAANLQGFREEIDQYTEIRNTITELTNLLKDMNTLTPDIHSESDFEELLNAIAHRLDE